MPRLVVTSEERRHAAMDEGEERQYCSDVASGGWWLFDPKLCNRGTMVAKAVCRGSAIRRTEFKFGVNRRLCRLRWCASASEVNMDGREGEDARMRVIRSWTIQGFLYGAAFSALALVPVSDCQEGQTPRVADGSDAVRRPNTRMNGTREGFVLSSME